MICAVIVHTVLFAHAGSEDKSFSGKCTILISKKIRPYMDAVEGIKAYLNDTGNIKAQFFFLKDKVFPWEESNSPFTGEYEHHAVVALGPEALLFLKSNPPDKAVHKVFTMVLNPFSLIPQKSSFCGIFLSVNAADHLKKIREMTPGIKKIGILFDPAHNEQYIIDAVEYAWNNTFSIIPIEVRSKKQVPDVLRENWSHIDGLLLIPDATVISSSLVKYIIKDGISNGVPTIGYNRFFIESGALMAFVYDYEQIGRQTGALVREVMQDKNNCVKRAAQLKVRVNYPIASQLNVNVLNTQESGVIKTE